MKKVGDFLYEKESYQIRGACFEVWKQFGSAYKESIYHKALAKEFKERKLQFRNEKTIDVIYKGEKVGKYRPASIIVLCIAFMFAVTGYAADKTWSGDGDASSWSDGDNWYPATEPTLSDDVTIDAPNASVSCDETFRVKSIAMGGRETSTLTSENFIYGTVSPASTSDIAILNRSGGTIILKGVGVLTISGQYKDSEGTLVAEPNFIFWVE